MPAEHVASNCKCAENSSTISDSDLCFPLVVKGTLIFCPRSFFLMFICSLITCHFFCVFLVQLIRSSSISDNVVFSSSVDVIKCSCDSLSFSFAALFSSASLRNFSLLIFSCLSLLLSNSASLQAFPTCTLLFLASSTMLLCRSLGSVSNHCSVLFF